jgi:AcrR family transcriptional regulator
MCEDAVKSRGRRYQSPYRAEQARVTRRRIVEAAHELFLRDGYAATSLTAIAEAAGVAVPTIYTSVGTKLDVLRAVVQLGVRGDDDPEPLARRSGWKAIEEEPDPVAKLAAFARFHRGICDREAAVFAQIEAAAGGDPSATEMLAEHDRQRYEMHERLARSLSRRRSLRTGLVTRVAADIIWTLASERTYLALVRDRGWAPDQYERWLRDQLLAALL